MANNILITIFTPTFGRGHLLGNLYRSIINQDNIIDIEWVIVDDGSTDNTKEIVNDIISCAEIPVRYFYQENQGKHIAINNGVKNARGKFFFIVDSDDILAKGSLEKARKWLSTITEDFAGVGGLKIKPNGEMIGSSFAGRYLDCTSLERRKNHIFGDKAEIFRTSLLKKYKFPVIKGENFFTEAYVWNKIAGAGYKIRWVNDPFAVCEYREDGLTKNMATIQNKNYKGYLMYFDDLIKYEKNHILKLKYRVAYYSVAKPHLSDEKIMKGLKIGRSSMALIKIIALLRGVIR